MTAGKSGDEDEGRVQGPRIPRLGHGPVPETPGPGMVVAVAVLWGMAEIPTWQAMGLDSFGVPAFR